MKKIKLKPLVCIVIAIVILTAASLGIFFAFNLNQKTNLKSEYSTEAIQKSVWGQISNEEKNSIAGSWQDAKIIDKVIPRNDGRGFILDDDKYMDRECYLVGFRVADEKERLLLGDIAYVVDVESLQVVGTIGRD